MRKLLCLAMALVAQPVYAQVPLMPGEAREHSGIGLVIVNEKTGPLASTYIGFTRLDAQTQAMLMSAAATSGGILTGGSTARIVGRIVFDFCVPRHGLTVCYMVPDPAAPTITAHVTFCTAWPAGSMPWGRVQVELPGDRKHRGPLQQQTGAVHRAGQHVGIAWEHQDHRGLSDPVAGLRGREHHAAGDLHDDAEAGEEYGLNCPPRPRRPLGSSLAKRAPTSRI